ncbi:polysaccharide deacetylase family protein [Cohnella nanjingensis]|uniref:Polysaccharide deacetylase family protein n=1 Tax=Cohnella nanjingensis TaxID=1387779 RepID=A0A7X0RXA2_9BACL|nr:polysaccharide deacetylase family protein [Cohnella nanjingensis]MBB6674176.1 polysaccharide deacetylase family protein [Cohnella nanjingensis]
MKTRATIAFASAALLLALSACGGGATDASPANGAASASATPAASSAAESPAPTPTAEPAQSSSPSPSTAAEKTYRMTKAYDIAPIDKTKTESKVVLLTFDDGPKAEKTLKPLLDTLDKHKAKAIFFVNGYRVKARPELLKEIDDRGQIIGNHSWDHIQLGKEKADKIQDQLERVQAIVKEVTGKTPVFFRPPNASGNDDVHAAAKKNGMLYMTWSNGSLDWALGSKTKDKPQAVIDNVLKQLHPGSNILMHELPWTGEALDRLLDALEEKGYGFVDPETIQIDV